MLFTENLTCGNYAEAIRAILSSPERSKQLTCLHQLVCHLFTNKKEEILIHLYFSNLSNDLAEILEARCKIETVTDLSVSPNIYDVTFSFHIMRCDFQKASHIAYKFALGSKKGVQTRDILLLRCQLLSMAFQTIQVGESLDKDNENACDGFDIDLEDSSDNVFITKHDIARELLKAEVRLALADANPYSIPPIDNESILKEALKNKLYDMAWIFAKEFNLMPYDILEAATIEAIFSDLQMDSSEQAYEWVIFNQQFINNELYSNYKMHWRLVISYIEMALNAYPSDLKILRTIAYTFLRHSIRIPTWLKTKYMNVNPGDLISTLIDFGDLKEAFAILIASFHEHERKMKDKMIQRINSSLDPKIPFEEMTLPYTQIDVLIHMALKANDSTLPIGKTISTMEDLIKYQNKYGISYD